MVTLRSLCLLFPLFHSVLFRRKSLCTAHTYRVGSYDPPPWGQTIYTNYLKILFIQSFSISVWTQGLFLKYTWVIIQHFFFFKYRFFCFFVFNLFIYLWLCWVFVSVRGLSLVVANGGHSSLRCAGLSLSRPLLLRSTGSRRAGSVVVAHGAQLLRSMWDLPRPGLEPVSPALAGGFSTCATRQAQ